jgi:AhpD family alkylhydroperoxidase
MAPTQLGAAAGRSGESRRPAHRDALTVSPNPGSDDGSREAARSSGPASGFGQTPPEHRFSWYVRLFFRNQHRRYGQVLEPARLWGRSPKVFAALALLYGALDRRSSPLEPALRSLVTVRVSQINWCAFCVDINSATMLRRGGAEEKLMALDRFESSPLFSSREKAALDYAEAITFSDRRATPEHFTRLRAHFDDDAIIELTALVAFQNLSSKFNAALGVEPQGFCTVAPNPGPPVNARDGRSRGESEKPG